MVDKETCQDCGADLRGPPIDKESLEGGWYGPWNGEPRYFSRLIGIEYQGGYDGVSEWMCPDCGARRGRWSNKLLADDEREPRYGRRQFDPTDQATPEDIAVHELLAQRLNEQAHQRLNGQDPT